MPVNIGVGEQVRIRYKGLFELHKMAAHIKKWLEGRGYKVYEKKYKHKLKAKGTEIEMRFDADRQINEYTENNIHVRFHCWDTKEVEVIRDGKKIQQLQGRLLVSVWGELKLDYQGTFDNSFLLEQARKFYHKFIIRHEIEDIWGDKLMYEMMRVGQELKLQLGMDAHSDVYDDMW